MHFYFFIIIIIKEKKRGQIMEKIYKYFKEINKLNTIVRTGWLNRAVPLERLESVGEHIFTMCLLALSTIDKYKLVCIFYAGIFWFIHKTSYGNVWSFFLYGDEFVIGIGTEEPYYATT